MTVIIPINDKYRIELDHSSWAVAVYKPHKDDQRKQWRQESWHRTLLQAVESLRTRLICEEDCYGIDEVINAISRSSALLVTAIRDSGLPDSWLDAKKLLGD